MTDLLQEAETSVVLDKCGAMLDEVITKSERHVRKAAEALYEELLDSTQRYLIQNADWNLSQKIERCKTVEIENVRLHDRVRDLERDLQHAAARNFEMVAKHAELTDRLRARIAELEAQHAG